MTDVQAELLKIIRAQLITSEARLFEHVSNTFRWLMATLFTANGGAIIGLLGWNDATNRGAYAALGWFAAGVVLSILMGTLSCIKAARAIWPMERTRLSIDQSLVEGTSPDKQIFDDLVRRNRVSWKTWYPAYTGGASLLCLIVGMLEIACRL
jgi:hypothetical protein